VTSDNSSIRSRYVVLADDDIDTDQIVPARFLTTTERRGFAGALFADRIADRRGREGFPLTHPDARGVEILVAGARFGCGSSREHAVWALREAGFRAVVAPSFGDIFRQNALQNGLVPVAITPPAWSELVARGTPVGPEIEIDLGTCRLRMPASTSSDPGVPFPLDPFARRCLLEGVDELGWLLSHRAAIAEHDTSPEARSR
jgi:3-isopropylmalate/(R)-2-methylmalate dehydratase small subunit